VGKTSAPPRQNRRVRQAAKPETPETLVVRLRRAMHARLAALAGWQDHRTLCSRCRAIEPPGDPRLCCPYGRPRLSRLLSLNAEVHKLRHRQILEEESPQLGLW
jgi:hypothetical protein